MRKQFLQRGNSSAKVVGMRVSVPSGGAQDAMNGIHLIFSIILLLSFACLGAEPPKVNTEVEYWKRAYSINDDQDEKEVLACKIGKYYYSRGLYKSAIKYLDKTTESTCFLLKIKTLVVLGRLDEAFDLVEKLKPDWLKSIIIGDICFKKGKYQDAYTFYRLVPEDAVYKPFVLLKEAECLSLLGETDEAQQIYSNLVGDFEGTFVAEVAKRRLKEEYREHYYIQLGAFSTEEAAISFKEKLEKKKGIKLDIVSKTEGERTLYCVRYGDFPSRAGAENKAKEIFQDTIFLIGWE